MYGVLARFMLNWSKIKQSFRWIFGRMPDSNNISLYQSDVVTSCPCYYERQRFSFIVLNL